ncbi:hypothetical protein H0H93_000801 [Arthromyces matolae]|nr:hypothetical protein H0H93_000801 [Arthromyces matolae]
MLAFLALTLALIGSAVANPITGRYLLWSLWRSAIADTVARTCGSHASAESVAVMEKHFRENKVEEVDKKFHIKVYFHVISEDTTAAGGNIPDSQIHDQIKVLNADYASTGVVWTLAGTDRTVNADWYNHADPGSLQQTEMKNALHKGRACDLNVYTAGSITSASGQSLLGYATFPFYYASNPKDDGVVILGSSLPGGNAVPFDLGRTLTHEAGHWVGLYHTFQNGCSAPGDSVDDTPYEASATFGCPTGRDTCPAPGLDPIRKSILYYVWARFGSDRFLEDNFMDYTDDSCMTNFTPGQAKRLSQQITTYRHL